MKYFPCVSELLFFHKIMKCLVLPLLYDSEKLGVDIELNSKIVVSDGCCLFSWGILLSFCLDGSCIGLLIWQATLWLRLLYLYYILGFFT
ncbi:hypothetical protein MANES_10G143950v8 [Manihot esculenta]|uniref:Uncharacterized protein n=1 Tax=Manihot esculenta TaxID=3983 RepID=A0ACB7H100_MANES|nr:hypothetical protein MANES_10G143950v8 [Manihot esculenta]